MEFGVDVNRGVPETDELDSRPDDDASGEEFSAVLPLGEEFSAVLLLEFFLQQSQVVRKVNA